MGDQLSGGTTIGGYLALHYGNFKKALKMFSSIALTGDVSGSGTFDDDGNMSITATLTKDPTITLAGDLSGSVTLTNLGNGTLTATVADNSHNHTIANVTGLQTALDSKLSTTGKAADANKVDGIDFYTGTTAPTGTTRLNMQGYFYATRVYNAVYNDLAEFMYVADNENPEPGDVMINTDDGLRVSSIELDKKVVGVYSDTYGYALGADDTDNKIPIGISGRVLVKIYNTDNMEPGDLLVTSNNKGYAMIDNSINSYGKTIGKLFSTVPNDDGRYWMIIAIS